MSGHEPIISSAGWYTNMKGTMKSTIPRRMACHAVAMGGDPAMAAAAKGDRQVGGVRSDVTPM